MEIAGSERKTIKEIDTAAEEYVAAKKKRAKATENARAAKDTLRAAPADGRRVARPASIALDVRAVDRVRCAGLARRRQPLGVPFDQKARPSALSRRCGGLSTWWMMARREVVITPDFLRSRTPEATPDPPPPQRGAGTIHPLIAAAKNPLQIERIESRPRACGHLEDFKILKGEPAENSSRRFVKWSVKLCAACNFAEQQSHNAEQKRLADLARPPRPPPKIHEPAVRVPHGTVLICTYDADAATWGGALSCGESSVSSPAFDRVHDLVKHLGRAFIRQHMGLREGVVK